MPTPTFALVTEGITDQIIIENILVGFFDDPNIDINPLQPLRDETDKHRAITPGNWHKVLEYCASDEFRGAFQFNDYIVIQIDSDVAVEYGITDRNENGQDFYEIYASHVLFAVSVQSIECWLLPLVFSDKKKQSKTVNCLGTLNQGLKSTGQYSIDPHNKKPAYYEDISKEYVKHKRLMALYSSNPSLEAFILELERTKTPPIPTEVE